MIGIIDYGMGNLYSVTKALERLRADVKLVDTPEGVAGADQIILPGVGAFSDAMTELKKRELIAPIKRFIATGKPFLGVCLGLQLLFEWSEEGGKIEGLGHFKGHVRRFQTKAAGHSDLGERLKIPHMGWNQVCIKKKSSPLFKSISDEQYFYFVHSYYALPEQTAITAGETDYGVSFTSVIQDENVYACQFHPEKSHDAGRVMLRNFLEIRQP